ncbi:hypothetical protein BDZ89DRAFT_1130470 [Hymenopellis radicata]|nr:hypothetical protein BDZ89DRAFT_1130470 [Hymenopellis radicata]
MATCKKENHWNPGLYSNFSNSEANMRPTGPQLIEQLPNISVFAAAIGTSGDGQLPSFCQTGYRES